MSDKQTNIYIKPTRDNCRFNTPEQFDDGWFCRRDSSMKCDNYEAWEEKIERSIPTGRG